MLIYNLLFYKSVVIFPHVFPDKSRSVGHKQSVHFQYLCPSKVIYKFVNTHFDKNLSAKSSLPETPFSAKYSSTDISICRVFLLHLLQ